MKKSEPIISREISFEIPNKIAAIPLENQIAVFVQRISFDKVCNNGARSYPLFAVHPFPLLWGSPGAFLFFSSPPHPLSLSSPAPTPVVLFLTQPATSISAFAWSYSTPSCFLHPKFHHPSHPDVVHCTELDRVSMRWHQPRSSCGWSTCSWKPSLPGAEGISGEVPQEAGPAKHLFQ